MNIFTFRKSKPIVGHDDLYSPTLTHRQWAFVIEKWSVGFELQNIYSDRDKPYPISAYWIGIETEWEIIRDYQGYNHTYYDGDNYYLRIGPFYACWWY